MLGCEIVEKAKSLSHKGVELRRMMYANPILPQRSHRRPVALDRTTLARLSGRTASQDRSARRRRCHLLHPPDRLPVALPPQGFPPQEHRLEILRPVATTTARSKRSTTCSAARSVRSRSPTRPGPRRASTASRSTPPPAASSGAGTTPRTSMAGNAISSWTAWAC